MGVVDEAKVSCILRHRGVHLIRLAWKERANLCAFRTFVRFVLACFCWFPLPLGVWERLRFVIVALPGLLSYLFFCSWAVALWFIL